MIRASINPSPPKAEVRGSNPLGCATNPITFIDLLVIQAIPLNCLYLFERLFDMSNF